MRSISRIAHGSVATGSLKGQNIDVESAKVIHKVNMTIITRTNMDLCFGAAIGYSYFVDPPLTPVYDDYEGHLIVSGCQRRDVESESSEPVSCDILEVFGFRRLDL